MKIETAEETQERELHGEAQFAGSIDLKAGSRIIERETQARVAEGETPESAAKLGRAFTALKQSWRRSPSNWLLPDRFGALMWRNGYAEKSGKKYAPMIHADTSE